MNAPAWLTALVSTLMILVAAYSAWRLAISRLWERATDYESDLLHLALGIAGAGMVAAWARTLPRPAWTTLFIAGALYFAFRTYRNWDDRPRRAKLLAQTSTCAIVVYMLLAGVAPSTIHGSSAGMYTMAGMPGMIVDQTLTFPTIGLIFVVGLCFYAVAVLNQITPLGEGGSGGTGVLAPRSVDICRIVIALVLVYAILTKLV